MIDLAILGLLREQDLHGYELRKRATELAGLRPAVSFGALYPALTRLEAAGAVQVVDAGHTAAEAARAPPTGSLAGEAAAFLARTRSRPSARAAPRAGRARKAYGLTEAGQQLLLDLMEDPATDDRVFPLKVAFCRYLPSSSATRALRAPPGHPRRSPGRRTVQPSRPSTTVADRLDHYLRSLREHDHQHHPARHRLARRADR